MVVIVVIVVVVIVVVVVVVTVVIVCCFAYFICSFLHVCAQTLRGKMFLKTPKPSLPFRV